MSVNNTKKIEEKIEELNDVYADYLNSLADLEHKQVLAVTDLEKKLTAEELKKIRNTIE